MLQFFCIITERKHDSQSMIRKVVGIYYSPIGGTAIMADRLVTQEGKKGQLPANSSKELHVRHSSAENECE